MYENLWTASANYRPGKSWAGFLKCLFLLRNFQNSLLWL